MDIRDTKLSREELLQRNLRSLPMFRALYAWIKRELQWGIRKFYLEHSTFFGELIFFSLFIVINGILMERGIDTAASAPGFLFFTFDLLNFRFIEEPYLFTFALLAFLLSWVLTRLFFISFPAMLERSAKMLFLISVVIGAISLVVFSLIFSLMVVFFLQ